MKWIIVFLLFVAVGCNSDDEIVLMDHYDLIPGVYDGDVYVYDGDRYLKNSDSGLENLLDWFTIGTIRDSIVIDKLYSDIYFDSEEKGRVVVSRTDEELDFTYFLLDNYIYLELDSIDYSMVFNVNNSGKSIESCKVVSTWFEVDDYRDLIFVDEVLCGFGNINGGYKFVDYYINKNRDTIAVFSIQHRPK